MATALTWPEFPPETSALFRRMYTSAVTVGGAAVWTSVTFDLDRTSHVVVHFGYEPCPLDDQFERVAVWAEGIQDRIRPTPT